MNLLRAWSTLTWLSFRRLLWSGNTLMVLLPLAAFTLLPAWRRYDLKGTSIDAFHEFSLVILLFVQFIVPICAVAYGTASIGGDREDHTLLFLLVRPVPRALILLAKFLGTLPLAVGLVVGSLYFYCWLAGDVGAMAFQAYLPAVFYMTVAYVCLFHFFAVSFRHATIIALIYSLFMELFLGNMPGIVKRITINYYGRNLIFDAGAPDGLEGLDPAMFERLSVATSTWTLIGLSIGGLILALAVFQRREYADLT